MLCSRCEMRRERESGRDKLNLNWFSCYFLLYLSFHSNVVRFPRPPRASVIVVCFSQPNSPFLSLFLLSFLCLFSLNNGDMVCTWMAEIEWITFTNQPHQKAQQTFMLIISQCKVYVCPINVAIFTINQSQSIGSIQKQQPEVVKHAHYNVLNLKVTYSDS